MSKHAKKIPAKAKPKVTSKKSPSKATAKTSPKSAAKGGGATPNTVSQHTYRVTSVPVGCTDYNIDDELDVYVNDPPKATIKIMGGGNCNGVTADLES